MLDSYCFIVFNQILLHLKYKVKVQCQISLAISSDQSSPITLDSSVNRSSIPCTRKVSVNAGNSIPDL